MEQYTNEVKAAVMFIIAAVLSFLAPIKTLIILTLVFFLFEFITDTACHFKKKSTRKTYKKLYAAIIKNHLLSSLFAVMIIVSAYMLDVYIIDIDGVSISKLSTSAFCVYSFISICRNSAYVCSHKAFKTVKKKTSFLVERI